MLELIFVVAGIGILAAMAIPGYVHYLRAAKATEAGMLVHAVAHRVRIAAEEGRPVTDCGPTPAEVPTTQRVPFEADACWIELGFTPGFTVAHQIALDIRAGGAFSVTATSDLDEDGAPRRVVLDDRALAPTHPRSGW